VTVTEHQRAALHLALADGFGPQAFQAMEARCKGPLGMLTAAEGVPRGVLRPRQLEAWQAAKKRFEEGNDTILQRALDLVKRGARLLVKGDADYPKRLSQLESAPTVLFTSGGKLLEALERPSVAVVGTREPSAYGLRMAEKLATLLAGHGVTVVSGAADGVDSAAHVACMEAGGLTVGVLGVPLGTLDAPGAAVRRRISQEGALISESIPGQDMHAGAFPQRNRIISGLADVVVVVEGAVGSGTKHTADAAQKQGRPLYAFPGRLDDPQAAYPNLLIASRAAQAVCALGDVLRAAGVEPKDPRVVAMRAAAADGTGTVALPQTALDGPLAALFAALQQRPMVVDEVVAQTGLSAAEANGGLLELELRGLVRRAPGGVYARVC
jgi:DNA processing protein